MDKRWKELGDLLVNYSVKVQKGEKVMIAMNGISTYPLMCAIYEACVKIGAYPQVQFLSEDLNRLLLKYGDEQQIEWVPEIETYGMKWADVYFGLREAYNSGTLWDVPAERIAKFRQAAGKVSALRWAETRWSLVKVPNVLLAQQAGIDEETLIDMFFDACLIDWPTESKEWKQWANILNNAKMLRLIGEGTDICFSIEGRKWQVDAGEINMPGGEIFTSPIEATVDGQIFFEEPAIMEGKFIDGIKLRWNKGKLVEASSANNQDFFHAILATDLGAQNIGEFAFGTNKKIKHFFRDPLIDEKMMGTVHIALGRAYPETGGTNSSAIHWDIIKDLRQKGQVYIDDNLIFQDGKMLLNNF